MSVEQNFATILDIIGAVGDGDLEKAKSYAQLLAVNMETQGAKRDSEKVLRRLSPELADASQVLGTADITPCGRCGKPQTFSTRSHLAFTVTYAQRNLVVRTVSTFCADCKADIEQAYKRGELLCNARCSESATHHEHDFQDDDVAMGAIKCTRCGETLAEFGRRWPELAERTEDWTPRLMLEWDALERFPDRTIEIMGMDEDDLRALLSVSTSLENPSPNAFLSAVAQELARARKKHPTPLHNNHEAYAVVSEELDETWDEVKRQRPNAQFILLELVQVAAMCNRWAEDVLHVEAVAPAEIVDWRG